MTRTTGDPQMRVCKLVWAQNELRRVADCIRPNVAPQVAKRVRSLLKSVDGAIRHNERLASAKSGKVA